MAQPIDDTKVLAAARAADPYTAAYAVARMSDNYAATYSATRAAYAAVRAAETAAEADAAVRANAAARAAAYADDAAASTSASASRRIHWHQISIDLEMLAQSGSDALQRTPLWTQADAPQWVRHSWTALCESKAFHDAGFAPWFAWYEALLPLSGTTPTDYFGTELTRRIALQPDEWWDRGAAAVNADIAAWLAERDAEKAVPTQVPAAYRFNQEGGRIGVEPLDSAATDPAAAQAFLDELRDRAVQAAERLESARNAVPFLAAEVSRLRDFLPTAAADLNPYLLRCRLATIDAAVVTLQSAGSSRELSDDPTMQVMGLSLIGRELLLSFPDLRTRERDEIARAIPPGQERQIVEALAETSKAAAQAPTVVTEQAVAALETISTLAREAADGPLEAQRERIVEQVMVDRNFRSEVARFGWNLWDRTQQGTLALAEHAPVLGFAALVGNLTNPALGTALGVFAVFASYGQVTHGLKLLHERFVKPEKEPKDSKKTRK